MSVDLLRPAAGVIFMSGLLAAGLVVAPLPTAITIAAAALLTGLSLRPVESVWIIGFLTAAFPKAGVKVGGFPFPVFLFLLVAAVVLLLVRTGTGLRRPAFSPVSILLLVWCVGRACLMLLGGVDVAGVATFAAWSLIPVALLLVATVPGVADHRVTSGFAVAMDRGFMVAAAYAVVQYFFGITSTTIPGLTLAWGDSYAEKHIAIFGDAGVYTKIPSTYQGGNIFGITAAYFLVSAALRLARREARGEDVPLLALSALAVMLSGSRTALVVAAVGLAALFVARTASATRKAVVLVVGALAYSLAVMLQPGLASRYTVGDITASGGAGRFPSWLATLHSTPWQTWLFGVRSGPDWVASEGGPGFFEQLGVIGVVLFVGFTWSVLRRRPEWTIPLLAVLSSVAVDSAYMFFPTLFLPAARAIGPLGWRTTPETQDAGAGHRRSADRRDTR